MPNLVPPAFMKAVINDIKGSDLRTWRDRELY